MSNSFSATKTITINTTPAEVWHALTTPEIVKKFMFGAEVVSDWKVDSPLIYKGIWESKPYEDKGTILEIKPEKLLKATYFSALSGLEDKPENYSTVAYKLSSNSSDNTTLTVTQDNIAQEKVDDIANGWEGVLNTIKQLLEK